MSTVKSTNILTREISLAPLARRLAGFFGLLDNAFRLVPDFGFTNKPNIETGDQLKKLKTPSMISY